MREDEAEGEPNRFGETGGAAGQQRAGVTPQHARTRPRPATLLVALLIGVGLLVHLREWAFLGDDAFISFRYARNLGEHGALVYNLDPLEKVEGYTNPLWVLVLALGVLVGLAPEQLAPWLTAGSSLVALVLLACIGSELRLLFAGHQELPGRAAFELPDLIAPALLVLVPEFVVWASSGLEASFALALGLGAVYAWLRGRIVGAALLAALAGLTRLDSLVWIASFGLAWLVLAGVQRRRRLRRLDLRALPWRHVALGLALFVGVLVSALIFRRLYYGQWLPNTWAIKQHGAALRSTWGDAYLRWWIERLQLVWLIPLAIFLRPRHLVLLAPLLVQLVWAWSIGGDFMAYSRFLLPATALVALLIGLTLAELRDTLDRRFNNPITIHLIWAAIAVVPFIATAWQIPARIDEDRTNAHLHIEPGDPFGFEGVQAMDRFARVRLAAGERLAAEVPPDTWISVGAAGALPYASRLPAFDSYGLVDPGVLEVAEPNTGKGARPGHQLHAPLAYVRAREPDLMCHIGWEAPRPPTSRDAHRRAGRGWAWACVETGPIPDPRSEDATLESRWYCCLRPADRFEHLDPAAKGAR